MTPRVEYKLRGARHRFSGGLATFAISDWNTEQDATCPFCGTKTRTVQMRLAQHNCYGFLCPGAGKTVEQAAQITLDEKGAVEGDGETDLEV